MKVNSTNVCLNFDSYINKIRTNNLKQTNDKKTEQENLKEALKIVSTTYNHQINNSLAPIQMLAQLVKNKSANKELANAMEIIISCAKEINGFTEAINTLEQKENIPITEYVNKSHMLDINSC